MEGISALVWEAIDAVDNTLNEDSDATLRMLLEANPPSPWMQRSALTSHLPVLSSPEQ